MRVADVAWNLAGLSAPLFVAALTVPALIQNVGMERFGLLALAWGLIGFAGIFDLGIGRATTQSVSSLRGTERTGSTPQILKTAERVSILSGRVGTVVLSIAVWLGAQGWISFSPELRDEVSLAGYVLAVTIPVQCLSAMFRGVNEAFESFREVNILRIALGVVTFLGPYYVAQFSTNVAALVAPLLASRLVALWFFRSLAYRCMTAELHAIGIQTVTSAGFNGRAARQLLTFGGWLTVTGVVYPVMMQADRFIIAGQISSAAVTSYTIPYEMVVQTLALVGAVTTVAFPRLTAMVHSDASRIMTTFFRLLAGVVLLMAAVALLLGMGLPALLPLWLGKAVPQTSVTVGQVLCIGLIPYTVGTMYAAIIHAHGRPDITAKSHLIQLPLYLALAYWLTTQYGVLGAAWAWNLRTIVDALMVVVWFHLSRLRHGGQDLA